jgi:hypothetical protein
MNLRKRILVIYVRLVAGMMLLALPFIFIPHGWMDAIHARMGMGELPDLPIIRYLTRSASALYGFYGALLLYLSFDVDRHRQILRFLALLSIGFGFLMVGIDVAAGLPPHWTWREGPIIVVESAILLWLLRFSSLESRGRRAAPDKISR